MIKNSIAVFIDGINRTPNVVMPLKCGDFLDERLDECNLALRAVKKDIFEPLTPVEIQLSNDLIWDNVNDEKRSETRYYFVANDGVEETQIGSGFYNHDLYLLEVTKYAECVIVDTLTYTNDIGRTYTENAPLAEPIWSE